MKQLLIAVVILTFAGSSIYAQEASSLPAAALFNMGKKLMYEGKLDEATKLLKQAREKEPANMNIKLYLARLYSWTNKWADAIRQYEEVQRKTIRNSEIHWRAVFGIAQVTSWRKNYNKAIALYKSILKGYYRINSGFKKEVLIAIGDTTSWKKEYKESIKHYNTILRQYPDDPMTLNRIAKVYFWDANYPKAREYAKETLAIDKGNAYAAELLLTIEKIKRFNLGVGYIFTFYTSKNEEGEYVQNHTSHVDFSWKVIDPLTLYFVVDVPVQNSIESTDPSIRSEWNADINLRFALAWRINRKMYLSWGIDYTILPNILPNLNTDINYSVKLSDRFDFTIGYKFTWDELDSAQVVSDKFYHQLSPGVIFYINREMYTRFKVDLVTDFGDFNFALLLHQSFDIDPKNSIQLYVFYGSGRSYQYFSDATITRDQNNVAGSIVYTHHFTATIGIETLVSYTNYIDLYQNVSVGLKGIFKF